MTSFTLCSLPATVLPMCLAGNLCKSSVGEMGKGEGEGVQFPSLLEVLTSLGGRSCPSGAMGGLT